MPGKVIHSPLPAQAAASSMREAGCDEAGRGCLAGPVVAAAVILPPDFSHPWLNDSKQLSEKRRMELRPFIMEQALAWGIGMASNEEIDEINILNASILAMHRALDKMSEMMRPDCVAIDGNRFKPWGECPWECYVKGDGRFANIAAASVLAKTERDLIMMRYHADFPGYGWDVNKAYPTKAHREAIARLGVTPLHRTTFRLI